MIGVFFRMSFLIPNLNNNEPYRCSNLLEYDFPESMRNQLSTLKRMRWVIKSWDSRHSCETWQVWNRPFYKKTVYNFMLHVTMCPGAPSKVGEAQEHQSKRGFNKTKQRSLEKQSECMHVSDMTVQYYTRHLQQNSSYSAACLADWFWVVLASIDQQCYLKSSFSPPAENHINLIKMVVKRQKKDRKLLNLNHNFYEYFAKKVWHDWAEI